MSETGRNEEAGRPWCLSKGGRGLLCAVVLLAAAAGAAVWYMGGRGTEDEALKALRARAGETGAVCAVACVGYSELGGAADIRSGVEKEGLAEEYPFLLTIPDERVACVNGGWDVYCIVPTDPDAQVTVNAIDQDEEGVDRLGRVVYHGEGPILLWCNVSDIIPNAQVTITTGDETVAFSPYISLMDGATATTDQEGRVYIF